MPRKSKLTRAFINRAKTLIEHGNYASVVCSSLGVSTTTWYRWLEEGRRESKGLKREFWDTIEAATHAAEFKAVECWQAAFPKDWRAAQKYLSIKHPDRWGEIDPVDLAEYRRELRRTREDRRSKKKSRNKSKEEVEE